MKSDIAPVVLMIFNRPKLTAQVYERIRAARPRRLLVVADGPRHDRQEDASLCQAARRVVASPDWPCELLTNFAEANLGCKQRVFSGIQWVFEHCSEAIILEDDCVPNSSFFDFCSTLLERYREDARVMHISGDNFQDGQRRGAASYYFSKYSLSWGWATWRRAWRHYDVNVSLWPTARQEGWLRNLLDDPLELEYWTEVFERLHRGEIDTWDYQWLFTCWCQNGLSVLPNENLVSNIGMGPDATHFKHTHNTLEIPTRELGELTHPAAIIPDHEADHYTFEEHIAGRQMRESRAWFRRLRNRLAIRTRLSRLFR